MAKRLYSSELIRQAIAARYKGSRELFAEKAGMHYHTLTKVLKEKRVYVDTLHLAAAAAKCEVYELFMPLCCAESERAARKSRRTRLKSATSDGR